MDGFLNINKAPGMTSFDVIKRLKRILPKNKFGHLGTLDPMAQGVLPVAVGFATRLIEYVSETDKVYQVAMTLGGTSDTEDAWGNIVYEPLIQFNEDALSGLLGKYTGNILQVPPMYSAVHHKGDRLYELARQGIIVDREARPITIQYIRLLDIDKDSEGRPVLSLEVSCSKGTYIRTLCHDMGQDLGTGAYLSALTRIRAGVFTIDESYSLEEIEQQKDNLHELIKAVDYPLDHLGQITVDMDQLHRILNGNRVSINAILPAGLIRIYDPQYRLVSIGECITEEKEVVLKPLKVFK